MGGRRSDDLGIVFDVLQLRVAGPAVVRPSNATEARWRDIDLEARVWTIPGFKTSRSGPTGTTMKTRKLHRVPLSSAAVALLRKQEGNHPELVFPGRWERGAVCRYAVAQFLGRMGYTDPNMRDEQGTPSPSPAWLPHDPQDVAGRDELPLPPRRGNHRA
jgi:hypothetical protein